MQVVCIRLSAKINFNLLLPQLIFIRVKNGLQNTLSETITNVSLLNAIFMSSNGTQNVRRLNAFPVFRQNAKNICSLMRNKIVAPNMSL